MKKTHLQRLTALLLALSMALCLSVGFAADAWAADTVVVTLDPGHGGAGEEGTSRTWNGTEIYEKDLNLTIAYYCKQALEARYENVTVYLTRTDDSSLSLAERAEYAASVGSDILVSIHNNAQGTAQSWTSGAEAIIPNGKYRPELTNTARKTASYILTQLESQVGVTNQGILQRDGSSTYPNGSPADYYGLIRNAVLNNVACTIIEHAFVDNDADFLNYLSTEARLKALGEADAEGIALAFDLTRKPNSSADNGDTPFIDVYENKWYYDNVSYVYSCGLMNGTSENTFEPEAVTSRAMLVSILYRLAGSPAASGTGGFSDVSAGKWYSSAIAWAAANGIVSGYTDGTFHPNDPVTREQMAAIFYRFASYRGYDLSQQDDLSGYTDGGQISAYALDAFRWAVGSGILTGESASTLSPKGQATRAQAAALLERMIQNCVE